MVKIEKVKSHLKLAENTIKKIHLYIYIKNSKFSSEKIRSNQIIAYHITLI